MRKTLIALIVCAVMVSAMTVTAAAPANKPGTDNVQQYSVGSRPMQGSVTLGTLTVDLTTKDYTFKEVTGKNTRDAQQWGKENAGKSGFIGIGGQPGGGEWQPLCPITISNSGHIRAEGTLSDEALTWFTANPTSASLYVQLS